MSEDIGKLDGLRDIIAPRLPEVIDYTMLWGVLVGVVLLSGFVWMMWKSSQQPQARARRLFNRLKASDVNQSGEQLIAIIRLHTSTHNLTAERCPESCTSLSTTDWQQLIDACNKLRFSVPGSMGPDCSNARELVARLLWPR